MRRPIAVALAAASFLAATLLLGWWQVDGSGVEPPRAALPAPLSTMDFRLTDHEGRVVGPRTLLGRPTMVFFGFTWCPDVCPTTLADISGWLDALGDEAEALEVVFVTIDPARDTVEVMAGYVSAFHPRLRGWTGSPEQIARAAEAFRVRYEKVPTGDGGYTMDHTASVFLFDADGRFVTAIDPHEPPAFAVPKIRRVLDDRAGEAA